MSADAERYERVAQGFSQVLGQVGHDQWSAQSPCEEWNVGQLVAHTINTQRYVLARLDGSEPATVEEGDDLVALWTAESAHLIGALHDPTMASTPVESFGSQIPFEALAGGLGASDTIVHTWDLAQALGHTVELDTEAVEHCGTYLAQFGDGLRRPGGFGDVVPSAPDDTAQIQFLHFCGRNA